MRAIARCFTASACMISSQMSHTVAAPSKLGLQVPHRLTRSSCRGIGVSQRTCCTMATLQSKELASEPAARPDLPRSGHCMASLPNAEGGVLVFGGYTETPDKQRAATNDAWCFNSSSQAWTKVQYAASSDGIPEPRITAQLVLCGGRLWLIGGWNPGKQGPEAFLSDVWSLDPTTWAWARHQPQGESLQGISRFQAVAVGDSIYIHTHRNFEDIYVLHTTTPAAADSGPVLEKVAVAGPGPSSRGLQSLVACGSSLYLFGGAPQTGPMLGDLWQLDLSSTPLTWKQLQPSGPAPHVRCSTIAAALDQRHILYVGGAFYGASGGLEMLGDAVLLDTQECCWVTPGVSGQLPSPRNAAAGVAVPIGGPTQGVLMYGGWKAFVESYNETFLLSLS